MSHVPSPPPPPGPPVAPPPFGQPGPSGQPGQFGQPDQPGQFGQPGLGSPPGGSWAPPRPVGPAPGVVYASHGARFGAFLIDGLLVSVVFGVVFAVFFALFVAAAASRQAGGFFAVFAFFPLIFLGTYGLQGAYFAVSWYRGGATPGMRVLGIRVVRSVDGGPLTKQQAVLRTLGYWVSGAVMYLGFIWILIDDRHQGWHDKIADTLVIESR